MHLIAPHRKASVRALDVVTLHWKKNGVTTLEKWRDSVITWQHCTPAKQRNHVATRQRRLKTS